MRWHTRPITQLVVMFAIMSLIVGVQGAASSYTSKKPQATSAVVAQEQGSGLRKVAGDISIPTCPNTDAVQYALTENNIAIAPPKRMRYVNAKWEYDSLNETYFTRTQDFNQAGFGTKDDNIQYVEGVARDQDRTGGTTGTGVTNIMSSMFRYKPTALKNAYVLKYSGAPRNGDGEYKGSAPAIEVPSKSGWPVCVPETGYDIGGGYEAMVVFVEGDRITLHIGIHEYMDGDQASLGNCPLGLHNCRGGYWLYISGINIDSDIVSAYNEKKAIQQGSNLSENIIERIQLPIVKPGRKLGTSRGDGVIVLLRDSGPIIYANRNFMWDGGFPEYNPGVAPTSTPPANATASPTVPPGTTPTTTPRTTPTLPPCDMSGTSCQEGCDTGYRCSSTLCIQNGRYSSICIQNSNLTPTPTVPTTGTATPSATRTPTTAPTNVPNGGPTDTPVPPTVTPTPVATVIPGVTPNITPGATSLKISFSSSENTLFGIIKAQADAGARSYIYYSSLNDPNTSYFQSIYSCDASSITCSYFSVPFNNITSLDRLFITFGSSDTQYHLIQPH